MPWAVGHTVALRRVAVVSVAMSDLSPCRATVKDDRNNCEFGADKTGHCGGMKFLERGTSRARLVQMSAVLGACTGKNTFMASSGDDRVQSAPGQLDPPNSAQAAHKFPASGRGDGVVRAAVPAIGCTSRLRKLAREPGW